MTDPIADLITRIRNGFGARKQSVMVPHSRLKEAIATVLKAEGFVEAIEVVDQPHKSLILTLHYINREPSISKIVRASKPGRRLYSPVNHLNRPLSGYGITIISTSKGVMTAAAARQANLGGEVLCYIY